MPVLRRAAACLTLGLLAGCATTPREPPPMLSSVRFAPVVLPKGVARSNRDLARDFLDLTFALENGEQLPALLRYETPVRVLMAGEALAPYRPDLAALLNRIRREAGIDIAETDDPAAAQIFIEAVPEREITRIFPTAACFIAPGERDWAGFRARRSETHPRWSEQKTLGIAAIFLPPDSTPQDLRDCLAEEITQALGPANDLYRLPDSIWNDDNFHGMATRFDMTILRALYQPEFHSGMTRAEVAAALPRVLDRVNPMGRKVPSRPRAPESRVWAEAIETAQDTRAGGGARIEAGLLATRLAAEMRPPDHRLGVAQLALGRATLGQDPAFAAQQFAEAYARFRDGLGRDDIRTAQAGVHLAALALAAGDYDVAILLADRHLPDAIAYQNAILAASLLSIKAEALAAQGDLPAAEAARLDSLRWARYGFGDTDGALAREQVALAAAVAETVIPVSGE
ncbi:MAG: ATP-dependent transcriptional regulator [Rhodovulum sulfidophilum]|uniref:ATP-dependent transcriptional regulator n=1 Tax=Rhodovulum sulfidophilum TaxID=35806 RepID=A0A2W5N6T6_RHOSU|nr:MAG: ATP-dependent transcriptional regulator [Rhodovulum sulfidophilum]